MRTSTSRRLVALGQPVLLGLLAAAVSAGLDAVFTARGAAGRDSALQLAPLLPYLGVDGAYVLARALGITALMFAALALSLGMAAGLSRAKQRPAPEWVSRGHRQCSVLALLLAVGHVALPYPSSFTPYGGWRTALLPFGQPFSWGGLATFAESLGIIAFWLMIGLGAAYLTLGRAHPHLWWAAHRLAGGVYVLSALHALFLGSDFLTAGPARVFLIAAQVPLAGLLAFRLWGASTQRRSTRGIRVAAALAAISVILLLAVTLAGVGGSSLGGFPLH